MVNSLVDTSALEQQYTSGAYFKRDIQIVRGAGARLFDSEGNSYIDCVGAQGAANLGHGHPAILDAIQEQAATLISCPEFFLNPVRAQYQAALCEAANMPRVFLCNSGSEANEGALKIAKLITGRSGIIATMRGFHGRTIGALSTTWEKKYREAFEPLMPGVTHIPYNNLERLEAAIDENTAAVILEPIQGEGGVHPAEDGYLRAAAELAHAKGALLILDEIQTGFGRTGTLFAKDFDEVQPDIMTVAKSMAGGLPMGAVLLGERIGELPTASHGSTFGGNPLVCAAGLAAMEVYQTDDLIAQVAERGEQAREHLHQHLPETAYRDIRGRGFLIGIELRDKVAPILKALQDRGVLALPAGMTVLRLLPPLVIEDDDLWQAVEIIEEVLSDAVS
jgi:acetylornithine/LysW-gamma-L-lysine aminotransferase